MRVRVSAKDLAEVKSDVAVCFAYEGDRAPRGVAEATLRRELAKQMRAVDFGGRSGDRVTWNANGRFPAGRYFVIGLGAERSWSGEAIRSAAARAARQASKVRARSLALLVPGLDGDDAASEARAAAEGVALGNYRFEKYLSDPDRKTVQLRSVELCGAARPATLRKAVRRGEITASAVALARDLVNEGPSRMTPRAMASTARREARRVGLRVRVLGRPELRRIGMSSLLEVSRGSAEPPQVVHLTYKPKARAKKKIVLVGKGVTFDSGGLDLKPASAMLTMKCDMAGAAAALATIVALAESGCRAEVHAILGLVENMTGAAAYKPGDILDTYSGKTVEVGNTDAEGRLVLCDLLAWAAKTLRPDAMVDLATLTGACVVALGTEASGLFSRHDALRDALLSGAGAGGEKVWPLPMYDEYLALLQHGPADLHNVGGRWGGAITAALFLGEFVPRELPWAHLDIAGPAFAEKESPEGPAGGTGAGVSTLVRWLESL